MIKALSDKTFRFTRDGERDAQGHLLSVTIKPGFGELPDWVGRTDLFQDAVKLKQLHLVSAGNSEDVQKYSEEILALKHEVEVLKQEKALRDCQSGITDEVKNKKEVEENQQIQERVKRAYHKKAPK